MNEAAARQWLVGTLTVSRETFDRLDNYRALVLEENAAQNLISRATVEQFWTRHIVDSAQLVALAADRSKQAWLDIGSGAGLPGIVTAILTGAPTILVEPRKRRADFLARTAEILGLQDCRVEARRLEQLSTVAVGVITARAVAPLPDLLEMALRFARSGTIWLLPKGKSAKAELASLPEQWQGAFTAHPSVTDPESHIIFAHSVSRRSARR